MRYARWTITAVVCLWGAAALAEKPEMGPVRVWPHAGIALAVPAGHEFRIPNEPYDVMDAFAGDPNVTPVRLMLAAYPAGADDTAGAFASQAAKGMRGRRSVREVEVAGRVAMPLAGLDGVAQRIDYVYRGKPRIIVAVYAIRPLDDERAVCYSLTVAGLAERSDLVLDVLGEAVRSAELMEFQSPVDIPVTGHVGTIRDSQRGYSIRVPWGWIAAMSRGGAALGQTDYTTGTVSTTAKIYVTEVTTGESMDQLVKRLAGGVTALGLRQGMQSTLLSQGDVEFAGRDGYQFVIRSTRQGESGDELPNIAVRRMVYPPPAPGQNRRAYNLIVACNSRDVAAVRKLADSVSAGFELLAPAEHQAPPTRPADEGEQEEGMPAPAELAEPESVEGVEPEIAEISPAAPTTAPADDEDDEPNDQ